MLLLFFCEAFYIKQKDFFTCIQLIVPGLVYISEFESYAYLGTQHLHAQSADLPKHAACNTSHVVSFISSNLHRQFLP